MMKQSLNSLVNLLEMCCHCDMYIEIVYIGANMQSCNTGLKSVFMESGALAIMNFFSLNNAVFVFFLMESLKRNL